MRAAATQLYWQLQMQGEDNGAAMGTVSEREIPCMVAEWVQSCRKKGGHSSTQLHFLRHALFPT